MEQINLLDLNIDVLNIIGDYVKKDNHDRMEKDYYKRKDEESKNWIFKYVDEKVKGLKKDFDIKDRQSAIGFVYHFFDDCGIKRHAMIDEYLTLKNLA